MANDEQMKRLTDKELQRLYDLANSPHDVPITLGKEKLRMLVAELGQLRELREHGSQQTKSLKIEHTAGIPDWPLPECSQPEVVSGDPNRPLKEGDVVYQIEGGDVRRWVTTQYEEEQGCTLGRLYGRDAFVVRPGDRRKDRWASANDSTANELLDKEKIEHTALPTEPGWYWWGGSEECPPQVVKLAWSRGAIRVYQAGKPLSQKLIYWPVGKWTALNKEVMPK